MRADARRKSSVRTAPVVSLDKPAFLCYSKNIARPLTDGILWGLPQGTRRYHLPFKPTVWAAYTGVWCVQPFIVFAKTEESYNVE